MEDARPWWGSLPGGPVLAGVLGEIDPGVLSDFDLVEFIAAIERVKGWCDAAQYVGIAGLARRRPATHPHDAGFSAGPGDDQETVSEFAADEIALGLCITTNSARIRVGHALELTGRLSDTLAALAAGRIDGVRARLISDATTVLSPAAARIVQQQVLPGAGEITPARLRRRLARAVLKADPAAAAARHTQAVAARKVVHYPQPDAMGTLALTARAWQTLACYHRLDADARTAKAAGDPRTMDALRADALIARILDTCTHHQSDPDAQARADTGMDLDADQDPDTGTEANANADTEVDADARAAGPGQSRSSRSGGSGRFLIQVTVPITSLLGIGDEPATLAGYGPIPASIARDIATDPASVWHRLLTDPTTGTLLDYGSTVYHPPPRLRAFVNARDGDCRLPVCGVPAQRSDFNHTIPFHLGGPTADHNGGPTCRHHHRLAQHPDWQLHQDPDAAIFTWTAPSGHTYEARPSQLHPPDRHPTTPAPDAPPF